jgi:hypothetical protein
MPTSTPKKNRSTPAPDVDAARRAFLKKSVYAAYATPLITALLVAEDSAAKSKPEKCGTQWCERRGNRPKCCR